VNNLESLGLLAGGIAHDFNNVLTGVMGNLALLLRFLDKDSREYEFASGAQKAATKTEGLTQQLMTFAKGGAPVKEIASLEQVIRETTNLSLHGANTKPEFRFTDDLLSVEIDTGQISQVIQNLVLNADQAMPNGGILRISAENVEVSADDLLPLESGRYVKVTVEDQGIGIPESILGQVFDPYFSTKESGHGLGLSICHSIIHRHGGHITVSSNVGVGTTFEFYLPASEKQVVPTIEPEKMI
jgi:signal transduction histidine kinase